MNFVDKMSNGMRRVWTGLATRLGVRKSGTGLLKLQKEVSSCEYGDVHVMWELLRRSEIEMGESPKRCKKRRLTKCFQWRRSPFHRRCFS
ncbi:hypothetical protein ERO13_D05G211800v2 [Gossypium hirsutum]|uniref:Uncharacterized protein n=4 Tax=Gossypium TaxID=3633 RepID=A0A9D3UZV9_9ROSI|nr:hypothetical protein ES319_D05G220000v1 [Gossypium barbadense]KAG4147267.1 hypothetical protein ERO13_D05G211800v2 [Gossypium hirsutum]KAH1065536.1 hypothetical protein J1N35_030523 [Gossypium stocksii]TYG69446.1 hypothetical protein ES288_D05G231100v1 [Gossypium darwinii]TYH72090.1 hypothetical protein ES332_D05G230300v1 [Gossypium tomentosum]